MNSFRARVYWNERPTLGLGLETVLMRLSEYNINQYLIYGDPASGTIAQTQMHLSPGAPQHF